jgi:hypothetical protein
MMFLIEKSKGFVCCAPSEATPQSKNAMTFFISQMGVLVGGEEVSVRASRREV